MKTTKEQWTRWVVETLRNDSISLTDHKFMSLFLAHSLRNVLLEMIWGSKKFCLCFN